jgi:hypothetical protein
LGGIRNNATKASWNVKEGRQKSSEEGEEKGKKSKEVGARLS